MTSYNGRVKHSIFSCPRCHTVLRTYVTAQPEKILRCSKCGFIFQDPNSSGTRTIQIAELAEESTSGPTTWTDWRSSQTFEPTPAIESSSQSLRRPVRVRQRRSAFPWVNLIVGLIVGLASLGLLIVLVVVLWPSAKGKIAASSSSPLPSWQDFRSTDGRFRVLFPGTPQFEESVVHTRLGSLSVKAYDVKTGEYEFSVFYGDLESEDLRDIAPGEWIDSERDVYMVRAKARLLAEKDISSHGYVAKERRYELSVGWFVARRMYAVNRRIYTVNFSRKKLEVPEDLVTRFFNSFEIMDQIRSDQQ